MKNSLSIDFLKKNVKFVDYKLDLEIKNDLVDLLDVAYFGKSAYGVKYLANMRTRKDVSYMSFLKNRLNIYLDSAIYKLDSCFVINSYIDDLISKIKYGTYEIRDVLSINGDVVVFAEICDRYYDTWSYNVYIIRKELYLSFLL